MRTLVTLLLCAAGLSGTAHAQSGESPCRDVSYKSVSYTVCTADMTQDRLELYLYTEAGKPYGQFASLDRMLLAKGKKLAFAMNAGMYHENRAPVGHYIENGTELQRVIPNAGPGNFGLLPNGVFCVRQGRADVIETLRYLDDQPTCTHATQSGPMLVIDGKLHPRFLPDSDSRYIRNGVGTSRDGKTATFVISNAPVNFHAFASFFRDYLKLPQALYFDGNISRLYAPNLNRSDFGFTSLGPIIGVVTDK
ncbi:phosphodiester glycosidase family protein [Neptunicoccus cionae]|nr:phosphodiester glycosidase family protein [Amylibacter cionae]